MDVVAMTCPTCRSVDTHLTGRVRPHDGALEHVCPGCDIRYFRRASNTPQGTA